MGDEQGRHFLLICWCRKRRIIVRFSGISEEIMQKCCEGSIEILKICTADELIS